MWALLIFRLTTTPQIVVTEDTWFQQILMMGAHFVFFGVQSVLLFRALSERVTASAIASLYGLAIEIIQKSVPGRSADPVDWFLDTIGAILFVSTYIRLARKHG